MKKYIYTLILLICIFGIAFADSKISNLDEITDIQSTDNMYVLDYSGGTYSSKRITVLNVFDMIDTLDELETISNGGAYMSDILAATTKAGAATIIGVGTGDSPQFTTTDLTGVTDGNIPYMASGAAGFADSYLSESGDNINLAAEKHLVIPLHNDAVTPTLAFGDGDTGLYETTDDEIRVAIAGIASFHFSPGVFRATGGGGARLEGNGLSYTDPNFTFVSDENTGINSGAADQLSLIAGGVEGIRISEDTTIVVAIAGDTAVTGQLSATTYASDGSVTDAELKYINTLSSNAQDQIDAKEGTLTNEAGLYSALSDVSDFVQPDEKFTIGATIQETGNADTTPDVSNAATGVNNIYRSNENGTITDFDDGDGDAHDEFSDGDFFVFIVDDASTVIDFSENANIEGNAGVDFTGSATQITTILFQYYDARWNAVNLTGGYSSPTTLGLTSIEMGSGTLEIPNDESADKTLANMGEVHIRGDEDTFNAHFGSGGEIAGEASISAVYMFTIPIDFTYVYDRDANHRIFLFGVNPKIYPNGITFDYVRVSYTKDPTTEITNADLKRADDIIGVANAAIIVGIDTTSGSFIEDTDANLNGGAVVAAGQDIYIELTDDPVDEDVLANVTILFHAEAD